MKKTLMMVLSLVLCASCATKKPVQQPIQQHESEAERLLSVLNELQELKVLKEENTLQHDYLQNKKIDLETAVQLPCQEEAVDDEKYYAALGVSSPIPNLNLATQDALRKAQMLLQQKKARTEELAGQNNTSIIEFSGNFKETEVVCQKITRDEKGYFVVYVAVRMPKNK